MERFPGVLRFTSRDDVEAWRNDFTHQSVWRHSGAIYESFWIQNSDVWRQDSWKAGARLSDEDTSERFARDITNVVSPGTHRTGLDEGPSKAFPEAPG